MDTNETMAKTNLDTSDPKINQMDQALNRFYILNGQKGYLNNKGDGRFKIWCQEQGFDDDLVLTELQTEATDSQIVCHVSIPSNISFFNA